MGTTVKAIIYALLVIIGTFCDLITGSGHLTPANASVIITGAVFAGVILIIDLKYSHSKAALILQSANGQQIEAMIEAKVAATVAAEIQRMMPSLSSNV